MKKETCAYDHCRRVDRLNDDGVCPRCEAIVQKISERVQTGRLPKMPSARLTPGEKIRTEPIRRPGGGGMPCAACSEPINDEHSAYPDFPGVRRYDLHFHDLCHEIWQKETMEA